MRPLSDDVIIGFGFVDPMLIAELKPTHGNVPQIVAKTIVRVAMSRTNAKQFLQSLSEAIQKMEEANANGEG